MYTMIYNSSAIAMRLVDIHTVIFSNHTSSVSYATRRVQLSCNHIHITYTLLTHYLHREFRVHTVFTQPSYSCREVVEAMQSRVSPCETSTYSYIACSHSNHTTLLQLVNTAKYCGYTMISQTSYNHITVATQLQHSCSTICKEVY